MGIIILIKLFLAHILTDFVFQPSSWVKKKNENGCFGIHFILHSFLAGFLTYLLLGEWTSFAVPIGVFALHALIDCAKIKIGRNQLDEQKRVLFFVDQGFHLIVILIAWLYLIESKDLVIPFLKMAFNDKKILSTIVAFIFVTIPAGIIIGQITEPFRKQLKSSDSTESFDSLNKAGIYIGITERILILIFVIMNQYAAIGLLIAGKSILRVAKEGDKDGRKKTEYILIGTLISFVVAIVTGLLLKFI